MKESLASQALYRFKNNMASYILVGVFCALFFVLLATLSFIDEAAFILVVPFLALPFLFASHISCYFLEANEPIKIGSFFRYFITFFRPQFRGSFRGIISFFKTLAVYAVITLISYLVFYLAYRQMYGDTFINALNDLTTQYLDGLSYEELVELLEANDRFLLTFIYYVSAVPIPFSIAAYMYFISYSSISVYYRANINNGTPSLMRLAIASSYSRYGRSLKKDWLKLNWLIFALPLIGSALGALICLLAIKNVLYLAPALTIGAFIPYLFFLPFYFPNMEVLYHRYENVFKEGNKMAIESLLERIQTSLELSEEEKRNLEESFRENNEDKE